MSPASPFFTQKFMCSIYMLFFFFNDTATTEIYTLSLHDALPIYRGDHHHDHDADGDAEDGQRGSPLDHPRDRKSTRLNSSHVRISYAVFCLKKKKSATHHVRSYLIDEGIVMDDRQAHCLIVVVDG